MLWKKFYRYAHGQGATEYLIVLSTVLLISLVSISLLSYFPGTAKGTGSAATDVYWQGEALPLRVKEAELTGDSNFTFIVENAGVDPVILKGVNLGGKQVEFSEAGLDLTNTTILLSAGEQKAIAIDAGAGNFDCLAGQESETSLAFIYETQYGNQRIQESDKKFLVNCNRNSGAYARYDTNQTNSTESSCEGGLFLPNETGDYYYRTISYDDATAIWFSMETPTQHQITYFDDGQYENQPPVYIGHVNACQQMSFSWMSGWWGYWGPDYADADHCNFETVGPNHWQAVCRNWVFIPVAWDDYDWQWEIYKA